MRSIIKSIASFWNTSIQRQLILGIAIVHALMMTIFVADLSSIQKKFLNTQNLDHTEALARTLGTNSISWILASDVIGLEEVINSLQAYPNIEYAMILSKTGKVLAHTDNNLTGLYVQDEISTGLLKKLPLIQFLVQDNSILDVAVPIFNEDHHIGWSRVAVSQKVIHAGLKKIYHDGILYTIFAILIGSIFAMLMAYGITTGLRQMLNLAKNIEHGKYDTRVDHNRTDEIGELSLSLNHMSEKIEQSFLRIEQSEKIAIQEKEKAEAYLNTAQVALIVLNTEGMVELINPHCLQILGYQQEELLHNNWFEFVVPNELREQLFERFQRSLVELSEELTKHEGIVLTKSGEERILQWRNTYLFNDEGQVTGILASGIDITDQKLAETALIESEKQFQDLFNSINDLIFTQDINGRFLTVNPVMVKLLGYSYDELIGRKASEFIIYPDGEIPGEKHITAIKKDGYHEGISKIKTKDNNIIYLEHKSSLVIPEYGVPYISGVGRDVTEKILTQKKIDKLQEQIIQSQKMEAIGTLAGGIAHDFNNILSPILGYSELLLMHTKKDDPNFEGLNQIFNGTMRAKDLVAQILTFSRQTNTNKEHIKLQPVITEAVKLIRASIPTTIDINLDLSDDCGFVSADSTQIHQIVMNLCTNGYHAMEETGGILKVKLSQVELSQHDCFTEQMQAGSYGLLTISDTGVGIPKEQTDKIFDPFYTTKNVGKGTGMGLSVVHGIVTKMGGAIKVYSEIGLGAEFKIYLPIETPSAITNVTKKDRPLQKGTETILLVDDEEALVLLETDMLESMGYRVISFTNSSEALETFKQSSSGFDLVLTDMAMPNISGIEMAREIHKIRTDIPILLCTGFSEGIPKEKLRSAGIEGLLLKPILARELSEKVRASLDEVARKKAIS